MRRGQWNIRRFLAVLALSALIHALGPVPLLVRMLSQRNFSVEKPTEVTFLDEDQAPQSLAELKLPPVSDDPDKQDIRPQPKPEAERRPPPPEPPPPEVAKVEPPKPEPPKPEPPKPEPPKEQVPPPPIVELPKQRFKMVDQDLGQDEPDNPDARYLAQKNHRAAEDTRSLASNLVKNLPGPSAPRPSSPSENQMPEVGDRDQKVAELEDRKGNPKELPRGRPSQGEQGEAPRRPTPGKLAMRDLVPRAVEQQTTGKPREGVELEDNGQGPLPRARVGDGGERAHAAAQGGKPRYNLLLQPTDYDRIVGFETAEAERRAAARGERSHVPGRWDRLQQRLALMRSSLENFTPEVRPGNQAELGTRAHPFAAYIAEMHRQIHKLWAFGFLADLEGHGGRSAYEDRNLWTQLEIVLRGDGSLEKVTIVRTSGNSGFDVAAIDVVSSSAPFPTPPQAIKSANGKVYLDWRFHRDERQCGTFGVDPHILTTVGDNQDHDTSEVERSEASRLAPPRILQRGTPGSTPRVVPSAPANEAPSETPRESTEAAAGNEPASGVLTVPQEAREAAEGWFSAYARGDVGWLAGWSAIPFVAGGQVVSRDAASLRQMYKSMLAEAEGDRRLDDFAVLTAAGLRARRGRLPPGGENERMLFAVGRTGGEDLVLLLKPSDKGWRVAGFAR